MCIRDSNNMTILFLPAAVGIMDRFNDIKDYLLPITIIILVAIFFNIATIGCVVQFIKTRFEGDYVDKGGDVYKRQRVKTSGKRVTSNFFCVSVTFRKAICSPLVLDVYKRQLRESF